MLSNDSDHLSIKTLLTQFNKERERKDEGRGKEGRKEGGTNSRERRTNPWEENTFIYSIFLGREHSWNEFEAVDYHRNGWTPSTHLVHYRQQTLSNLLGSNMPNTPTLQTVSQCFTSRLHYFSNWSQHAVQAILAYQPLVNLSPFPIKGMMRMLQMQKFHKLNSFQITAFFEKS